jgi:hypothetical protein
LSDENYRDFFRCLESAFGDYIFYLADGYVVQKYYMTMARVLVCNIEIK